MPEGFNPSTGMSGKSLVAAVLTAAVAAAVASVFLPNSEKSYAQYTRAVLKSQATAQIAQAATKMTQAAAEESHVEFDSRQFGLDFESCLRTRMSRWLESGDPQLQMSITKAAVPAFANRFVEACLAEINLPRAR